MASIQSLGVGSGLLTSDLVEDIIAAEREATDLRLDARRAEFDAKISAFGTVRSQLDNLESATSSLSSLSSLQLNTATTSDETVLTATASSAATPGINTIEVSATARSHTLSSLRYDSVDTVIGEGTLTFQFGTTTFNEGVYDTFTQDATRGSATIIIDSSNNTLDGIRDAINAADIGVTANVIDDGEGFRLTLVSDTTGDDSSLQITVAEGAEPGLSAIAFNAGAADPETNLTQVVAAQDAALKVNGIDITRSENTISDIIPGITLNLLAAKPDTEISISVAQDVTAISDNLQAFVEAYNEVKSLVSELADYDAENETAGLLTGDATLRNLDGQLRRVLTRAVDGLASDSIRALVDLGISTNQNNGFQLQFDRQAFETALQNDTDGVIALLASQSRASDSQISVSSFSSATQAGEYSVEITQAATRAQLLGTATAGLASSLTVDDNNDTLSVTVDGVTSGSVALTQGVYADGAALAVELQAQINADATLRAAGKSIEVAYDVTTQQLSLTSSSYGSSSNVGITAVDVDTLSEFGLTTSAASANVGLNVAGTINGVAGTGIGQLLSIPSGTQAATSGSYSGLGIAAFETGSLDIDADNNTFRLSVDGTLSQDIVITQGTYATGADLAAEIQSQIDADANFTLAGKSAVVSFDAANNRLEITSGSEGLGSSVNLTFAQAGTASDLGLAVAQGDAGRNASTRAEPSGGISVRVQGDAVGERGTVTIVRGVMNQLQTFLSDFTGFGGGLNNRINGLGESIDEINEEAADFSARMDLVEARLRTQFAAADALIATLNSTSSFLEQQLASLPGVTRDE